MAGSGQNDRSREAASTLEEEVGDLFFVLVNIARYLSVDPESALRKTNRKFKRRFQWMEEPAARDPDARPSKLRWKNSNRCGSRPRRERDARSDRGEDA